jgi:uncharacterized protein (DUF697 family)
MTRSERRLHTGTAVGDHVVAAAATSKRELAARKIVDGYMKWAAAGGLIPVPYLDLAAVAAVQYKMLSKLADLYEMPFREERTKSIVSSLLGGAVPADLAWGPLGSALKVIPVIGYAVNIIAMPIFAGAATYAVGRVFIQHFESGGTFLTFDPAAVKEYFAEHMADAKETLSGGKTSPSA